MLKVLNSIEELFEERKTLSREYEALRLRLYEGCLSQKEDDLLADTQLHLADIDQRILAVQPKTINDISIMAFVVKYWQDEDGEDDSLIGFDAKLTRAVATFFPLEV